MPVRRADPKPTRNARNWIAPPPNGGDFQPVISPRLSILIPTLSEQASLPFLLGDLEGLETPHEVIVADGGSTDDTARVATERGAVVVTSPPGRGTQLAAAARAASGHVFCALHADVRLPVATLAAIDAYAAHPPAAAMAFSLAIDGHGRSLALIAAGANLRSRLLGLPYGDQGLLMTRAMYSAAGGYAPVPIMEDVMLVRALARVGGVTVTMSPQRVLVSARRWQRDGPWRRSFRNVALLLAFLAGVPVERLARWYGASRTGSAHVLP